MPAYIPSAIWYHEPVRFPTHPGGVPMTDPQYGFNLANLEPWPERIDFPGDTCSGGHPHVADELTGECLNCAATLNQGRDAAEDAADFRTLAEHVIELLNPPIDGCVLVSNCVDAVTGITVYVESLKCRCSVKQDGTACPRCRVLGRHRDEKVQR